MAYNTKQSCEILQFMKDKKGTHLTAQDIVDHFRAKGVNIGSATVYIIDDKSPACYEYIGMDDCNAGACYHMKCESCGKLLHLSCDEINAFFAHIRSEHGFMLDPKRTVFYGLCDKCQEAKA